HTQRQSRIGRPCPPLWQRHGQLFHLVAPGADRLAAGTLERIDGPGPGSPAVVARSGRAAGAVAGRRGPARPGPPATAVAGAGTGESPRQSPGRVAALVVAAAGQGPATQPPVARRRRRTPARRGRVRG